MYFFNFDIECCFVKELQLTVTFIGTRLNKPIQGLGQRKQVFFDYLTLYKDNNFQFDNTRFISSFLSI